MLMNTCFPGINGVPFALLLWFSADNLYPASWWWNLTYSLEPKWPIFWKIWAYKMEGQHPKKGVSWVLRQCSITYYNLWECLELCQYGQWWVVWFWVHLHNIVDHRLVEFIYIPTYSIPHKTPFNIPQNSDLYFLRWPTFPSNLEGLGHTYHKHLIEGWRVWFQEP